jgi:hypothetical protein
VLAPPFLKSTRKAAELDFRGSLRHIALLCVNWQPPATRPGFFGINRGYWATTVSRRIQYWALPPEDPIDVDHLIEYSSDEPPVFFGYYWMDIEPALLASNVAYRWDGEQQLSGGMFVYVVKGPD